LTPPTSPVTAQRIIDRLCTSTENRDGYTRHVGFIISDGYEFVAALNAWRPFSPIRLLPDGGDWPYSFALAADAERAMIEYTEGDIAVRVYDVIADYRRALAEYEGEAP
jgi:hypothetical protein